MATMFGGRTRRVDPIRVTGTIHFKAHEVVATRHDNWFGVPWQGFQRI